MANGKVRDVARYCAGKILDHSAWTACLPRGCSPSDIDAVFDDMRSGRTVLVELKEATATNWVSWQHVAWPQREVYRRLVDTPSGRVLAVLAGWHGMSGETGSGLPCVDTAQDVVSFDVMYRHHGRLRTSGSCNGDCWVAFMQSIYEGVPTPFAVQAAINRSARWPATGSN